MTTRSEDEYSDDEDEDSDDQQESDEEDEQDEEKTRLYWLKYYENKETGDEYSDDEDEDSDDQQEDDEEDEQDEEKTRLRWLKYYDEKERKKEEREEEKKRAQQQRNKWYEQECRYQEKERRKQEQERRKQEKKREQEQEKERSKQEKRREQQRNQWYEQERRYQEKERRKQEQRKLQEQESWKQERRKIQKDRVKKQKKFRKEQERQYTDAITAIGNWGKRLIGEQDSKQQSMEQEIIFKDEVYYGTDIKVKQEDDATEDDWDQQDQEQVREELLQLYKSDINNIAEGMLETSYPVYFDVWGPGKLDWRPATCPGCGYIRLFHKLFRIPIDECDWRLPKTSLYLLEGCSKMIQDNKIFNNTIRRRYEARKQLEATRRAQYSEGNNKVLLSPEVLSSENKPSNNNNNNQQVEAEGQRLPGQTKLETEPENKLENWSPEEVTQTLEDRSPEKKPEACSPEKEVTRNLETRGPRESPEENRDTRRKEKKGLEYGQVKFRSPEIQDFMRTIRSLIFLQEVRKTRRKEKKGLEYGEVKFRSPEIQDKSSSKLKVDL